MISGLGTTNPIQMLNATNAFKAAQSSLQKQLRPEATEENFEVVASNDILKNQNINEIRDFAKILGEENLSTEDIKYGLTMGRSVIADYLI